MVDEWWKFDLIAFHLREWVTGPTMKAPFFLSGSLTWEICRLKCQHLQTRGWCAGSLSEAVLRWCLTLHFLFREVPLLCAWIVTEHKFQARRQQTKLCFYLFEIDLILSYSCLLCRYGLAGLLHCRYCKIHGKKEFQALERVCFFFFLNDRDRISACSKTRK